MSKDASAQKQPGCGRTAAARLAAAGSSRDQVVKVNVYLRDINDFAAMTELHARFFTPPYSARTTTQAGFSAIELAAKLAALRPSIVVRSLMAQIGLLRIDLRRASDEIADYIVASIEKIVSGVPVARRSSSSRTWKEMRKKSAASTAVIIAV